MSLRSLFVADGDTPVRNIMRTSTISTNETMSQEEIATLFSKSALMAIPVIDDDGRMKGIITVDDIVEVVEEEATEDIQRLGGSEVLDAPYLKISLPRMIRKRAGWLVILFLGEMLTAMGSAAPPSSFQRTICSVTSWSTHSVIGPMRPHRSATGRKPPGLTTPQPGRFQRISASAPASSPLPIQNCGW